MVGWEKDVADIGSVLLGCCIQVMLIQIGCVSRPSFHFFIYAMRTIPAS